MILTWGQQARPVGLSTLEQVLEAKDAAEAAATTAAADAFEAAQPLIQQAIADGAANAAIAAADCVEASARLLLPVRARIMGVTAVNAMPENRLPTKKSSCRPSRLGRAKM